MVQCWSWAEDGLTGVWLEVCWNDGMLDLHESWLLGDLLGAAGVMRPWELCHFVGAYH